MTGATLADPDAGVQPLTAGAIALANLHAQIDGLGRLAAQPSASIEDAIELIELLALRGHVLGRIFDYESAQKQADQLTRIAPEDGRAFVARARARALFHRFPEALDDLDRALRLGAAVDLVDANRAAVLQAVGRYDAALAIYDEAAKPRSDFNSIGAAATLHAERGETAVAERLFDRSRGCYRGVSPFPPALLAFRRGHMWLAEGELDRARTWFGTAVRHVPAYAPAQGHLAEVEAALGETDSAIVRLLHMVDESDDPEYAAALAHVLSDANHADEAVSWRDRAASRYDVLLADHPDAFADHAAEFWLGPGANPARALQLAQMNLDLRDTPRARNLLARASSLVTATRIPEEERACL